MNSNAELFESQYPNFNIKETLLTKQNGRCHTCSNFIMKEDIQNCKLKYKTHLQNGGQNHIENIGLLCPQCYQYASNISNNHFIMDTEDTMPPSI